MNILKKIIVLCITLSILMISSAVLADEIWVVSGSGGGGGGSVPVPPSNGFMGSGGGSVSYGLPSGTNGQTSKTPIVEPFYGNDAYITGTGVPGSVIIVKFKDNKSEFTIVNPAGIWLVKNDMKTQTADLYSVNVIQTQIGYNPSSSVSVTRTQGSRPPASSPSPAAAYIVIPSPLASGTADVSKNPLVNTFGADDFSLAGRGVPGADIYVSFIFKDTINIAYLNISTLYSIRKITVSSDGTWSVQNDLKGYTFSLSVYQQESGKSISGVVTVSPARPPVRQSRTIPPSVNPFNASDDKVTGTGVPGANIKICTINVNSYGQIVASDDILSTIVQYKGDWSLQNVWKNTKGGDTLNSTKSLYVYQYPNGYEVSDLVPLIPIIPTSAPKPSISATETPGPSPAVTPLPVNPKPIEKANTLIMTLDADIYTLNGKTAPLDVKPENINGSLAVPVRFIAEAFGAGVIWNDKSKTASIVLNGKTQTLTAGVKTGGMPFAPYIKNGRLMVPLRFIAENYDCDVSYDQNSRAAKISW